MTPPPGKYVAAFAIVVVLGAVIAGLVVMGPPSRERARRMDLKRVEDLETIARTVDAYRSRHQRLPSGLAELAQGSGPGLPMRDPATEQPYEYRVLSEKRYELCASFEAESPLGTLPLGDRWSHRAGRQCFEQETRDNPR